MKNGQNVIRVALAAGVFSGLPAALPASLVLPVSHAATAWLATGSQEAKSWVRLNATVGKTRYVAGEPISVRLTATNTHNRGAYLRFTSGQRFDFSVIRETDGAVVYTWSAARMFIQALGSLWLPPGRSQSYTATVGDEMGQLPPGRYRLAARLANSPRSIAAPPVRFEIVASPDGAGDATATPIALSATTDKATYKLGEPVQISVTAANRKGTAVTLPFDSGMTFDVIIKDAAGRQVWTYGANLRFIRVLGSVTWRKGEVQRYSATWNGIPLPGDEVPASPAPGSYSVQAVLQSTPNVAAPVRYFEIGK